MDEIKACTKAYLHKKLYATPEKELRRIINTIVAENRGIPIDKIKYVKSLRINEVRMVYEELGYL